MWHELLWALVGACIAIVVTVLIARFRVRRIKDQLNATIDKLQKFSSDAAESFSRREQELNSVINQLKNESETRLRQNTTEWQGKLTVQKAEAEANLSERLKSTEHEWQVRLKAIQTDLDAARIDNHSIKIFHADELLKKVKYYESLFQQEGIDRRRDTDAAYREGHKNGSHNIRVEVRPYIEKFIDRGIIYDDYWMSAGYQYQLIVNNLPCFEPHIVIERREKVSAFNKEALEQYTKLALQITQALANGKVQDLPSITVDNTPIIKDI